MLFNKIERLCQMSYQLPFDCSLLKFVNKIEMAFLWSAPDTTTDVKFKVNWVTVCRPNLVALGS
jgi:hypothetical protein